MNKLKKLYKNVVIKLSSLFKKKDPKFEEFELKKEFYNLRREKYLQYAKLSVMKFPYFFNSKEYSDTDRKNINDKIISIDNKIKELKIKAIKNGFRYF